MEMDNLIHIVNGMNGRLNTVVLFFSTVVPHFNKQWKGELDPWWL